MRVNFTFLTHKGYIRRINEDYFGSFKKRLFIVADGLGGHAAGEVASRLAVEEVIRVIQSQAKFNKSALESAIFSANLLIFKKATADPRYFRMATTLVALLISNSTLTFASVGDSMAFLLRNGKLDKVTHVDRDEFGFLTQAIGLAELVSINVEILKVKTQDLILLATDGLTDLVSQDIIQTTLKNQSSLDKKAYTLIEFALKQGGHDNITVCLIKLT